jgi:multiple sugar transport system substrate-binding protein
VQRRTSGLVAAGLALSLAATLTACGGEGPLSGPTTLTVVAVDHGDQTGRSSQEYWNDLAKRFSADHEGITVEVEVYSRGRVDEEIAGRVESGDAPDLAITSGSFAEYADRGELYTATDVASTATLGALIPSLADAGAVHRTQYALPFSASLRAFFWNKKHFEKAGLSDPPETWAELREAAEALDRAGVADPYALPLGPDEAEAETMNWMLSGGGAYTDDGGAYTIDSAENVATFTWLRDELVGPGLTNAGPATTDRVEAHASFMSGEVGMLNADTGLIRGARENKIEFGTAPLPGKDGPLRTTTGVADWLMAFDEGGHREQIRSFLDFLYSDEQVIDFADTHHMLPVTAPASQAMREDKKYERLWDFLDAIGGARYYPVGKLSWAGTVRKLKESIGTTVERSGKPHVVLGRVQRDATALDGAALS